MATRKRLIVVGHGMVGHRFVQELIERDLHRRFDITVLGEEPRRAYDRVHLSELFAGRGPEALQLPGADGFEEAGVRLLLGAPVVALYPAERQVRPLGGAALSYDRLVLATGSAPFVPPIAGRDGGGCFVYRTIDDLQAIERYAAGRRRGAIIGGGLLGLEAAHALLQLGLEVDVVEVAPHLMAAQLDGAGGEVLQRAVEALGVRVHVGARTTAIARDHAGAPAALCLEDGRRLPTDLVVFSAGVRPRDELAHAAGLALGPRGGVAVDASMRTSDSDIYAIGECASFEGRCVGLVAPGYRMARVAAAQLAGDAATTYAPADPATELKLLGIDVASFGVLADAAAERSFTVRDDGGGRYARLVFAADRRLLGGVLVGDKRAFRRLVQLQQAGGPVTDEPEALLFEAAATGAAAGAELPANAPICTCNDVSRGALCAAVRDGARDLGALRAATRAGSGCGGCVPTVKQVLDAELAAMGVAVSTDLCEHFSHTRQELYHLVRTRRLRTFAELLAACGRGHGCEICKPAVASILAACWNDHVLDPAHAGLQDSNDAFLANLQRDGSYSVVPRVPGGEITPDGLIAIGRIAKRDDLYSKITGGQRIDLFGARVDQLPAIWRDLIAAGFESGHAYGKALRTVKSCVGDTWCRYGVQDSVGLAIELEHRYKGLRAPHKIKMAVSGCTRECAEAQGKDVGVIATERGYNLYVGGNGGARPRHAELLASDLDRETLIRTIDRFLMFYIRTADRLQRTARWLEQLEGGLAYVRGVVLRDELGICAELEAEMRYLVSTYQCEWRAVLADPAKLRRFRVFVNDETPDDEVRYVRERGQRRPARPEAPAAEEARR